MVREFREEGIQLIMCSNLHPLTVKTIALKTSLITHDTARDIAVKVSLPPNIFPFYALTVKLF